MTFDVDVNGQVRSVKIDRVIGVDNRFTVTVNGRQHVIDARRLDQSSLSVIFCDQNFSSHMVTIVDSGRRATVDVEKSSCVFQVGLNIDRSVLTADTTSAAVADGLQEITAPMPGRVVKLLVAAGDPVIKRQGIVVVEAMKMENTLTSPTAGRVVELKVKAGAVVEAGLVLATVEQEGPLCSS